MTDVHEISEFLDQYLDTFGTEDYSGAVNGLQLTNSGGIRKVACAVDLSLRTIKGCIDCNANLLLVHHGMFWAGPTAYVGSAYKRIKLLLDHDIAVYSSHLPLDRHPVSGNNVLLARELQLQSSGGFAKYRGCEIGLRGESDISTNEIETRARNFAKQYGGAVVATGVDGNRRTRRWGLCSGAGASADTLSEARSMRIDTLIVGEGPHWTAVAAEDDGIVVIYAGHYATETLGVQDVARIVGEKFLLPSEFVHAPTGL